jgi:DnaJ-class molecular chaperone
MNCPRCGGQGVLGPRDEFGNWDGCDLCEGTGVDPDDPAFPI